MSRSIYKFLLMGAIIVSILLLVSSYDINHTGADGIVSKVKYKTITGDSKYESFVEGMQLSFLNDRQNFGCKSK